MTAWHLHEHLENRYEAGDTNVDTTISVGHNLQIQDFGRVRTP